MSLCKSLHQPLKHFLLKNWYDSDSCLKQLYAPLNSNEYLQKKEGRQVRRKEGKRERRKNKRKKGVKEGKEEGKKEERKRREEGRRDWVREENDMFLFRHTELFLLSLFTYNADSGLKAGAVQTRDTEWGCDDNSSSFPGVCSLLQMKSLLLFLRFVKDALIGLAFLCFTLILSFYIPTLKHVFFELSGLHFIRAETLTTWI